MAHPGYRSGVLIVLIFCVASSSANLDVLFKRLTSINGRVFSRSRIRHLISIAACGLECAADLGCFTYLYRDGLCYYITPTEEFVNQRELTPWEKQQLRETASELSEGNQNQDEDIPIQVPQIEQPPLRITQQPERRINVEEKPKLVEKPQNNEEPRRVERPRKVEARRSEPPRRSEESRRSEKARRSEKPKKARRSERKDRVSGGSTGAADRSSGKEQPAEEPCEIVDGQYCVKFFSEKTIWKEADRKCKEDGGNLFIIDSDKKYKLLQDFIKKNEKRYGLIRSMVFIGAADRAAEGTWRWVDGTDLSSRSKYWLPGEPNNYQDEDCAVIAARFGYKMIDTSCNKRKPYICEYPDKVE